MPNNQSYDPRVALVQNRLAQAISLVVSSVSNPNPPQNDGQGYISFDSPVIEHNTTGTAITVRLVRRQGVTGSVSVSVSSEDKFRPQGVQSYSGETVTFNSGELTKTISVPLNSITLDGEAHFYLRLSGNPITYNDIRYHETNAIVVVDDGSEASDGIILTDPATQIIQNNIADNKIIYIGTGTWNDPSIAGYSALYDTPATTIYQKQNVVLRNRPGQSPIITTNSSHGVFIIDCDYVHVKGLEITSATVGATGIPIYCENYLGRSQPETYFDNKYYYIYNNHVHDWYGADNTGGIRLDDSYRACVFNNSIHDGFDIRSSSNNITADPYGLHAGVHGYRPRECVIYQNTIYHVKRGIYQKTPNVPGTFSHLIARNYCHTSEGGLGSFEHQGAEGDGAIPAYDIAVFENIVKDTSVVSLSLHVGSAISQRAKIYNNTTVDGGIGTVDYVSDVDVWNNLLTGILPNSWAIVARNNNDVAGPSFTYFNYNGYVSTSLTYFMDRYGTDSRTYTSLAAWQATDQTTGFKTSVVANPDQNAASGAVTFVNAAADNYALDAASTQYINSGRFGEDMGAYRLGHEQIGATI